MISNLQKRAVLILIALLISVLIWYINASWGNTFWTCFILSTTTFLIIYTPFVIYWSFRDIWFDRWSPIYVKNSEILNVKIKVEGGFLSANLIKSRNQELIKEINVIVVICHGFSDTKETHQYFYFPLVHHGYIVLIYDARGIGESKKTGKRSQFFERIEDFKTIIRWIKENENLSQMKIYCVGFSIGATTILCGGFQNEKIEKIVAISSISDYKEHAPSLNPLIKFSYRLKGVNLLPNEIENRKLSPYHIIYDAKSKLTYDQWKLASNRVLLIHSRNDKIINFQNFEKNKSILELSNKNLIVLKKGGHTLKKDEHIIVGATLKFFNS